MERSYFSEIKKLLQWKMRGKVWKQPFQWLLVSEFKGYKWSTSNFLHFFQESSNRQIEGLFKVVLHGSPRSPDIHDLSE